MPVVAPPTITALPSPPDPNNRGTFNALAYPWSVAQGVFATQVGAVAANVAANATDAKNSADYAGAAMGGAQAAQAAAAAQATIAANTVSAAGAVLWVTGTTYAIGNVVYSPLTLTNYRRRTAGAGATDPSLDATNWISLGGLSLAQLQANALSF